MALATTYCRAPMGMDAPRISVETHLANGLPAFNIVGLAETAVKESKDRVRSALMNSHFEFPQRKITINLAPADIPKRGGRYDLAIALGILAASGQIPKDALHNLDVVGELALSGDLRAVSACLPTALQSKKENCELIIPQSNHNFAALSQHDILFSAKHLLEVTAHLHGKERLPKITSQIEKHAHYSNDFAQVKGHVVAKRALKIAAAGRHHILMAGPPGGGKTLLASCLPSILPPMQLNECIETASIYSLSHAAQNNYSQQVFLQRPICCPHHSASAVALVGGGNPPMPGEISRAHNGILFLDEFPEFSRHVIESLREPLESGEITIVRAAHQAKFYAKFMLVAAMNCCPCGYYLSEKNCRCTPDQIQRYQSKLSGPLLDRIDLSIFVKPIKLSELESKKNIENESSEQIQEKVIAAHNIQISRQGKNNSDLSHKEIEHYCELQKNDKTDLINIVEQLKLSMRSYHRILKVARTIADLENSEDIQMQHVYEALSYRNTQLNK